MPQTQLIRELLPKSKIVESSCETLTINQLPITCAKITAEENGILMSASAGCYGESKEDMSSLATFKLLKRFLFSRCFNLSNERYPVFDSKIIASENKVLKNILPPLENHKMHSHDQSNGVAFDQSLENACDNALLELVERDRLLRSWYGEFKPHRVETLSDEVTAIKEKIPHYNIQVFQFHNEQDPLNEEIQVCAVFAFPQQSSDPFFYGFGAERSLEDALHKALQQTIQRLSLIMKKEIPLTPPSITTVGFNQYFFSQKEGETKILSWLEGNHLKWNLTFPRLINEQIQFVEMFHLELDNEQEFVLAKALSNKRLPLIFGNDYSIYGVAIPQELATHPIC